MEGFFSTIVMALAGQTLAHSPQPMQSSTLGRGRGWTAAFIMEALILPLRPAFSSVKRMPRFMPMVSKSAQMNLSQPSETESSSTVAGMSPRS